MRKTILLIILFFSVIILACSLLCTEKNIKNVIYKQYYSAANDNITISKLSFGYNSGFYIHAKNIKTNKFGKIADFYCLIKLTPIVKKIIFFKSIKISNANIKIDVDTFFNKKKSKSNGSSWNIFAQNINLKNIKTFIKISNENVKYNIKCLELNNFSLNNNSSFKLDSTLTYKKHTGTLLANGIFNFSKSEISAHIKAKDFNLSFLKKFGVSISNLSCNADISGNISKKISSVIHLNLKNVQLYKFKNLSFKNVSLNSKVDIINHIISIKDFKIFVDKDIKLSIAGNIKDFKDIDLALNTGSINSIYFKYFLPDYINIGDNGSIILNKCNIKGGIDNLSALKVSANLLGKNLSGNFKNYKFSKVNFCGVYKDNSITVKDFSAKINNSFIDNLTIHFKDNILTGNGLLDVDLQDIPKLLKKLDLHSGRLKLNISSFKVPLKNFHHHNLKFKGSFSVSDAFISYDFFKNIHLDNFYGKFNDKIIQLINSDVIFRNKEYKLVTTVESFLKNPVKIKFSVKSNFFDSFFDKKFLHINISDCANISTKVDFSATINKKFKLKLNRGYVIFHNSSLSFLKRDFKNIKGKLSFKQDSLFVKNLHFNYNKGNYQINGKIFSPFKKQNLDIYVNSNILDKEIAKLININSIKNIEIKAHLTGSIKKINIDSANIKFKKSKVIVKKYILNNIKGNIFYKNEIAQLNNISFNMFNGRYLLNGKIISPFKKQLLDVSVKANVIDKFLLEKFNIPPIKNLSLNANIKGTFKNIILNSADLNFKNSIIKYNEYTLKKVKGKIFYNNSIAKLANVNFYMNKIKYQVNGEIVNPFTSLKLKVNIHTKAIDSMILKRLKVNLPTIKPVNANILILGKKIGKEVKFKLDNSTIIFLNSKLGVLSNVKGKLMITKDYINLENLSNGNIRANGYLSYNTFIKKGYFSIKGKDIIIPSFHKKKYKKHKKTKKTKKKIKKEKKENLIKKVYNITKNLNLKIDVNIDNLTTELQHYKNIILQIRIKPDNITIKNCCLSTFDKGYFKVKKGGLSFGKLSKFYIDIEYDNINIGDFINLIVHKKDIEFRGNTKKCYITIKSNFKKFDDFERNLNGKFNIYYKDGYINKAPLIANIFSILNVLQIFKFKLPDLDTKGFSYKDLIGTFTIKNGIVSTKSLKLSSDSINLIYFGDINLIKKNFNAHIAVYPFKSVDSIIKHIPIIGYLFSDKKGRSGVVVIYLRLTGPLSDPSISVQPAGTVTKKVESVFKNIIKLPFKIFTSPEEVILPGASKSK